MIDAERIEHVKGTRLCAEHAKAIEKHGGEFRVTLERSSLAKRGSLKGNPGDVAVVGKERNAKALEKLRREIEG